MGESYRGLTIRLGADTTDLRKALQSVNAALTTTQREIKRVDKALKMDGGNVDLLALKMREVSERTSDLEGKMLMLARAEAQLDGSGIKQLAEQARNTSLSVERMKEAFNEANRRLEVFNRSMRGIAEANGLDTMQMDAWDVVRALESMGLATKDQVNEYKRLATAHTEYQAKLQTEKEIQKFRDLKVEMGLVEAEAKRLARDFAALETSAGFGSGMSKRLRDIRTAMGATERTAEALAEELDLIDKGLKLDPHDTELAELRLRNLREQANLAAEKVDVLEKAINDLKSAGVESVKTDMRQLVREVEETEEAYVSLRSKIARAEAAIDDMRAAQTKLELDDNLGQPYQKLVGDIAQAEAELVDLRLEAERAREAFDTARAQKELRDLETRAEAARSSVKSLNAAADGAGKQKFNSWAWRSFGVSLSSTVTPALMMAGYSIVNTAETFDAAYRDMRKTVSGTEEQFEELRQAALDYASTHVTSADTILEIQAMGAQLGLATSQLEEFSVVVSNLDIATNLDAETLAQTMGQLNNVLGWSEGDMKRFGDALVRLGNNMPAMEDQIVEITKRIGAAGSMYGMTTPEILAWSTAIASTGQNSEAAGTAISNSLSDIENAVASGGDKLAGFAEVAGMGAEDFARMWEEDASAAFLAFVEGLNRIEEAGGSADVALTNLGITGVRQKQALKGLSQTTDVLSQSLIMSENAWNGVTDQWGAANDAATEAEKKSEGFSGAMAILRNNIDETKILVAEGAVPIIEKASEAIGWFNTVLESLPDGVDTAIIYLGLLAAAIGPAVNIRSSAGNLARELSGLGDAFDTVSGKQRSAAIVKGMLKNLVPVGIVASIFGIGSAIGGVIEDMENFEKATDGLVDASTGAFTELENDAKGETSFFSIYAEGYKSVGEEVDALIEAQAQLASKFMSQNFDFKVESDQVSAAATRVQELMQKSNKSAAEVAELKNNLDILNKLTGSDLTYDDATGQIVSMGEAAVQSAGDIANLAKTFHLSSGLELTTTQYMDAYVAHAAALDELAAAQKAYDDAWDTYNSMDPADYNFDEEAMRRSAGVYDAAANLERLSAAADGTQTAMDNLYYRMIGYQTALSGGGPLWDWLMSNDGILAGLTQSGKNVIDFHDVLGFDLGQFDAEVFNKLTRDQLIELAANFDGTKESIVTSLHGFVSELQATSPEAAAALQAWLQAVGFPANVAEDTGAAQAGADAGQAYVDGMVETIRDGEDDVIAAVGGYDESSLAKAAPTVGANKAGVDNSMFVPDIEDATALAVSAASAFGDEWVVALDKINATKLGFKIVEKTSDGMTEAAPEAAAAAEEVGERTSGGFSSGADGQQVGAEVVGDMASGMQSASGAARQGGRSAGKAAQSGAGSVDMYQTGYYYGYGLASGIYGSTDLAVVAARRMAQRVEDETRRTMMIASPSKVGRYIGTMWDRGIGQGIEDEAGYAVTRAVELARGVTATASDYSADFSRYAQYAGQAATSAHSAAQMAQLKYSGPSKADIYDAVSAALGSNRQSGELAVYIDGRQLASSISRPMDSQLGTLAARKGR